MEPNVLNSVGNVADYGGWLGSINGMILLLLMAMIGIFALYFSARWITGERSMLLAIIVAVIAFVIMYALMMFGTVGWVLLILFIVAYVIVIKFVYCRGRNQGWLEAVMIWGVTVLLAFIIGIVAVFLLGILSASLTTSASIHPILTYTILLIVLAVCVYIVYWVAMKIITKPKSYSKE